MDAQQEPTLRFVEEPYEPAHVEQLEAEFRDRGFVLLPDVFERVSVAPFRAAVQKKLRNLGTWDLPSDAAERVLPALAPRLRRFLPRLLSPPMPPQHGGVPATAQIFEMGWDACAGAEPSPAGGWHFDRGGQGSAGDGHYIYPEAVHAAMYCALPSLRRPPRRLTATCVLPDRDIEPGGACGSTVYLPGSHLQQRPTPPKEKEPAAVEFTPRAQDAW